MRVLVDTNVLLRSLDIGDPRHGESAGAIDALRARGVDLFVCMQILVEFWVVSTRPKDVNGVGLSSELAHERLTDIREVFDCLPDPADMPSRWLRLVSKHRVLGRQAMMPGWSP